MLITIPSVAVERDSVLIFLRSESFAQSVKKALEMSGYRGTAVSTESVALTEAKRHVPSLIILDRQSSSIGNFRRMSTLTNVPIVAVEEGASSCQEDECLQEYDQDVDLVVCSQSVRELVARVRAILRRQDSGVATNTQYSAGNLRMEIGRAHV